MNRTEPKLIRTKHSYLSLQKFHKISLKTSFSVCEFIGHNTFGSNRKTHDIITTNRGS